MHSNRCKISPQPQKTPNINVSVIPGIHGENTIFFIPRCHHANNVDKNQTATTDQIN